MGKSRLARQFARRELRSNSVHGMEDPANEGTPQRPFGGTCQAHPIRSSTFHARKSGASEQRSGSHVHEGRDKMLTRLSCKLQEKRRTFTFGFEIDEDAARTQDRKHDPPLEDLVRDLGSCNLCTDEQIKKRPKKKEGRKRRDKIRADKSVYRNNSKPSGHQLPGVIPPSSPSDQPSIHTSVQLHPQPVTEGVNEDDREVPTDQGLYLIMQPTRATRRDSETSAASRGSKSSKIDFDEQDARIIHLDHWEEASTEKEKLRKRFGQGTRNLFAISRRNEQKGARVIRRDKVVCPLMSKEVPSAVSMSNKPVANAFSFGFAL